MADQLFEVAFSGQLSEGASLDEVKAKVGKMFNADDSKIAQLFSGKRIVIKKNIDQATAAKYKTALNRAGAECEIKPMGGVPAMAPADTAGSKPAPPPAPAATESGTAVSMEYESRYDGETEPPPQTDPLGITGDQIEDLAASLAPVGSELQDNYDEVEEPQFDTAGLEVAPAGSDLSTVEKEPDPPPPNTTGIELAD